MGAPQHAEVAGRLKMSPDLSRAVHSHHESGAGPFHSKSDDSPKPSHCSTSSSDRYLHNGGIVAEQAKKRQLEIEAQILGNGTGDVARPSIRMGCFGDRN